MNALQNKSIMVAAAGGALLAYAASRLATYLRARSVSVNDEPLVYYYWPARGRGEQIRLALAEAAVEWTQPSFTMGDAKGMAAFFEDCRELGGNLTTNVPMLKVDGLFITQSSAVLRYVARKYGLYPNDTGSKAGLASAYAIDSLIDAAEDIRSANYSAMKMSNPSPETKQNYKTKVLPKHLKNFERLLGSAEYFAEGRFSVADLTIYDVLDVCERQVPGCLDAFPSLKLFHTRVELRPNIAKWIASEMRAKQFAFPPVEF